MLDGRGIDTDLMNENLVYMLIGVAVTVIVAAYPISQVLQKRRHAEKVWARVTENWTPVHDQLDHRVRQGGRLTIANPSDWPVGDVMVLEPSPLSALDFARIDAHEKRVEQLPEGTMNALNDDSRVVLQLTDVRGRTWKWVSEQPHLRYLAPPRSLRSRAIRRLLASDAWQSRIARLPRRLHILILGEDSNIHIPGLEPDLGDWDDRPPFWARL